MSICKNSYSDIYKKNVNNTNFKFNNIILVLLIGNISYLVANV